MLWPQKFDVFIFSWLTWNTNFNSKLEGEGKDLGKKESIHVVKNGIFFHNYQGEVNRDKWVQACRLFDDLSVKNFCDQIKQNLFQCLLAKDFDIWRSCFEISESRLLFHCFETSKVQIDFCPCIRFQAVNNEQLLRLAKSTKLSLQF